MYLVRVRHTTHTTHDTEYVVVNRVDTDLGGSGALDGSTRKNELESRVINAREIARSRWLMLLWAESERVAVDTSVGSTGVVLPWLNKVEVGALTLREAVLAVELQLGGDDRVLAPAVHVKRGLGKHEGAGVREGRARSVASDEVGGSVAGLSSGRNSVGSSVIEETRRIDESVRRSRGGTAEGVESIRESINGVSVVERLSTESLGE